MLRDGPISARDMGGVLRCANGPFFTDATSHKIFSVGVIYGRERTNGLRCREEPQEPTDIASRQFPHVDNDTDLWVCIKKLRPQQQTRRHTSSVTTGNTTSGTDYIRGISYFPQSAYRDSGERRSCELQTTPMHPHGPEPPVVLSKLAGVSAMYISRIRSPTLITP